MCTKTSIAIGQFGNIDATNYNVPNTTNVSNHNKIKKLTQALDNSVPRVP